MDLTAMSMGVAPTVSSKGPAAAAPSGDAFTAFLAAFGAEVPDDVLGVPAEAAPVVEEGGEVIDS